MRVRYKPTLPDSFVLYREYEFSEAFHYIFMGKCAELHSSLVSDLADIFMPTEVDIPTD